jgi:hypothetical protein
MHIATYQHAVMLWMEKCFGKAMDETKKRIRAFRFFEEAAELVQASGMTREEAHQQVDYTFDRPVGKPEQELGGVMVTLAAWAGTHDLSMEGEGGKELARIDTPEMIDRIRAKQASKPGDSPLPQPAQLGAYIPPGMCDTYRLVLEQAIQQLPKETGRSLVKQLRNLRDALKPGSDV